MTNAIRLTHYINQIERAYVTAREQYALVQEIMESEKILYERDINSGDLSHEGKKNRRKAYESRLNEQLQKLNEIRTDFQNDVKKVRNTVSNIFAYKYEIQPEKLDLRAAELLKSGALSMTEIKNLAKKYSAASNPTMFRYTANFLKDENDGEARQIYALSKTVGCRPDLDIISSFEEICLMGLRDDARYANGVHDKLHAKTYQEDMKLAEPIFKYYDPLNDDEDDIGYPVG